MKKLLFIAATLVLISACKSGTDKSKEQTAGKVIETTVDELMSSPDKFIDQMVTFTGLADHICRQTGKKMFLVGSDPGNRVRVNTGENMGTFDVAMEGSNITVTGKFTELRITEEYLAKWEAELTKGDTQQAEEMKDPTREGTGHAASTLGEQADMGMHVDDLEQIKNYRTMLAEQNTDHLSFYSVECTDYKLKQE